MSNFIVKCNQCDGCIDVKTKIRFDKIKKQYYLCKICIIENKSRVCPKCSNKILYQSPYFKKQAEVKNSICKNCCSNQIPRIFTDNQKEFIDGLLLGDASIVYSSKINSLYPRLTLSRKAEDKDYLAYLGSFNFDERVVLHGSFQFAKAIQNQTFRIAVYCNLPKFECLFYYPRFGKYLLNSNYIMLPFGELNRRKDWITEHVANKVFVRPSSASKVFTGTVLQDWNVPSAWRFNDQQELVVVAPAVQLVKEWRTIVVKNKIIASCQYKELDKVVRIKEVPDKVIFYGQGVLNSIQYQPDPAWVLDICEDNEGQLKVLEVGSFSCSGFYACDPYPIIEAMEKEWA